MVSCDSAPRRPAVVGSGRQKACGALEAWRWARLCRERCCPPGRGVFLAGQLGDGNVVVVGIAEVVGAVHVGAAKSFGDQVHRCRRAVAEFGQIVAFEDIERAHQHHSARGWRRRAEDGVVVKGAGDGRALDDGVLGEVVEGDAGRRLFSSRRPAHGPSCRGRSRPDRRRCAGEFRASTGCLKISPAL